MHDFILLFFGGKKYISILVYGHRWNSLVSGMYYMVTRLCAVCYASCSACSLLGTIVVRCQHLPFSGHVGSHRIDHMGHASRKVQGTSN